MTRKEQLLVVLGEECSEVAKATAKALRFGLNTKAPNDTQTNRKKISNEFNDLYAVIKMCVAEGILNEEDLMVPEEINDKQQKVEKYLKYSMSEDR